MSSIKKTDRKNKTNQVITWPSNDSYFTIDSLLNSNVDFKEITLRVRVKNAIQDGTIVELGTIHGGKGRPKLAFAMAPVTDKAIQSAKNAEVLLKNCYSTVNVMNIKTVSTPQPTVEPKKTVSTETVNA